MRATHTLKNQGRDVLLFLKGQGPIHRISNYIANKREFRWYMMELAPSQKNVLQTTSLYICINYRSVYVWILDLNMNRIDDASQIPAWILDVWGQIVTSSSMRYLTKILVNCLDPPVLRTQHISPEDCFRSFSKTSLYSEQLFNRPHEDRTYHLQGPALHQQYKLRHGHGHGNLYRRCRVTNARNMMQVSKINS